MSFNFLLAATASHEKGHRGRLREDTKYHWNNLAKTRKSINKQASTHQHKYPAKEANSSPLENKLFRGGKQVILKNKISYFGKQNKLNCGAKQVDSRRGKFLYTRIQL